jgi:hypothetical protein
MSLTRRCISLVSPGWGQRNAPPGTAAGFVGNLAQPLSQKVLRQGMLGLTSNPQPPACAPSGSLFVRLPCDGHGCTHAASARMRKSDLQCFCLLHHDNCSCIVLLPTSRVLAWRSGNAAGARMQSNCHGQRSKAFPDNCSRFTNYESGFTTVSITTTIKISVGNSFSQR